jgi:hypothetical protein
MKTDAFRRITGLCTEFWDKALPFFSFTFVFPPFSLATTAWDNIVVYCACNVPREEAGHSGNLRML